MDAHPTNDSYPFTKNSWLGTFVTLLEKKALKLARKLSSFKKNNFSYNLQESSPCNKLIWLSYHRRPRGRPFFSAINGS
ncbi:hypothetical protein MPNT_120066 [Candidatus Methylacidithermus pantelleriae]|uniref:Uncharacterized protein n=1 Tax=Candidatus Methylacidithermus pantelleriae TaxID=2744239 RepID=A0A8J2FNI6_9BACT|nr:hypothetical protein MPNT_120066 [Candidatus Methylacidithermus pantelleriae]